METRPCKLAFVLEEFGIDTPSQQLLDRFLMGYPRDGEFYHPGCQVNVWLAPGAADGELRRRVSDYAIVRHDRLEDAMAKADGIIVVPRSISAAGLLESVINASPSGAAVFVHGALAETLEQSRNLAARAAARQVLLAAGTPMAVTWRLPAIDLAAGTSLTAALIVVQGEFPLAELYALDGLFPMLERRRGGESGLRSVRRVEGPQVWNLEDNRASPGPDDESLTVAQRHARWPLLGAALSRSDSPQGDAVRDGRTQDLLGLGLVPKLATNPRAWVLEHADGLRTILMVLDGVVADFNFALRTSRGGILSAQLYRPPAPQRHEFSRLAAMIERFVRSRVVPWPVQRSVLTASLLNTLKRLQDAGNASDSPVSE